MKTYVVHRSGVAVGAAGLDAALTRLRTFEEEPHALQVRWLHSYALRQADGGFGLACVFQAASAQALHRHAARTGLAAQEILPVAATLPARAFAPTRVYLVRRRNAWRSAAALERGHAVARRIGDEQMALRLSWLHSYAVQEPDGALGSVCLYQAVGPEALHDHAARAGLPADEIVPVIGRIVFRDASRIPPAPAGTLPG